jgi:hypothetical protein
MKASLGCLDRLSAVLVLLGSIAAVPAAATVVPISNPSFETVNTAYGCTTGSSLNLDAFIATVYLGSSCSGADPFAGTWSVSGVVGVWHPGTEFYPLGVPDGTNVAFTNEGSISQILSGSMVGLGTYTLGVYIGGRCDSHPINNYTVTLLAGGSTPIASDSSTLVPSCGTFVLDTLSGTTNSSLVGESLEIVLSSTNLPGDTDHYQAAFDKVSLDFQPAATTPEPASFFLMGSGLLAMGGILRRRIFGR